MSEAERARLQRVLTDAIAELNWLYAKGPDLSRIEYGSELLQQAQRRVGEATAVLREYEDKP